MGPTLPPTPLLGSEDNGVHREGLVGEIMAQAGLWCVIQMFALRKTKCLKIIRAAFEARATSVLAKVPRLKHSKEEANFVRRQGEGSQSSPPRGGRGRRSRGGGGGSGGRGEQGWEEQDGVLGTVAVEQGGASITPPTASPEDTPSPRKRPEGAQPFPLTARVRGAR